MMVKLDLIVRGEQRVKRITGPGEYPPCFESSYQFAQWKKAAERMEGAPPPVRKDWPKEPNYCRDCNACFRNQMRSENRCLFPSTVFIEVGEGDEKEVVGTTK
jgi:hypothetical protein